jgi:hypothetical protein
LLFKTKGGELKEGARVEAKKKKEEKEKLLSSKTNRHAQRERER